MILANSRRHSSVFIGNSETLTLHPELELLMRWLPEKVNFLLCCHFLHTGPLRQEWSGVIYARDGKWKTENNPWMSDRDRKVKSSCSTPEVRGWRSIKRRSAPPQHGESNYRCLGRQHSSVTSPLASFSRTSLVQSKIILKYHVMFRALRMI